MSEWGTIADKLSTLATGAVAGLSAERGKRLTKDLIPEDYPHLFIADFEESAASIEYQQEAVDLTVSLSLLTLNETQEATLLKSDAIRDAIRGDRTLTGSVIEAMVTARGLRENPGDRVRAVDMTVVATSEA